MFDVRCFLVTCLKRSDERRVFGLADLSALGAVSDIWDEWRFEPWIKGSASGLYRRATMVKSSFMGEIARYYADDYLVWRYAPDDIARIRRDAKPEKDLMVQRYIFLQAEGAGDFRKSSFMLGLRGFIEIYKYTLGDEAPDGIVDIAYLCNAANKRLAAAG